MDSPLILVAGLECLQLSRFSLCRNITLVVLTLHRAGFLPELRSYIRSRQIPKGHIGSFVNRVLRHAHVKAAFVSRNAPETIVPSDVSVPLATHLC